MSLHLIIGDKLHSSWSLRAALALDLAGAPYTEELIKLNQPDTRERLLKHSPTAKVPLLKTDHGTLPNTGRPLSSAWMPSAPISGCSPGAPVFVNMTNEGPLVS